MRVRAKFKVHETGTVVVWAPEGEGQKFGMKVYANVVTGDSPEDKEFYTSTPSGRLELTNVNPVAGAFFKPGKSYYADFTEAD